MSAGFQTIESRLGMRFLADYADKLVSDPKVAIVEIVSNCSDAGADRVKVTWPIAHGGELSVSDNGIGMTYDEFVTIWPELNYNRRDSGNEVVFPDNNKMSNRKLFGTNGKGRLSLFCFDSEYHVKTWKHGEYSSFTVKQEHEHGRSLFSIYPTGRSTTEDERHGFVVTCNAHFNYIPLSGLQELLEAKFLADTSFEILVNGTAIRLKDLSSTIPESIHTEYGDVLVYLLDSKSPGRTSQLHGVAWHVNGKVVGSVDWRVPNGVVSIDARTSEAKQYSFVVVVDMLEDSVRADWTGFRESAKTNAVLFQVGEHIQQKLDELFYEKRQERKQLALDENRQQFSRLPVSSRERIEAYLEGIQSEVRTINQKTLNAAVRLLSTLEAARTGYELLHQLAEVEVDDVDRLSQILREWSVRDAQVVLDELGRRLKLIEMLTDLVDKDVDELKVIHPLIEQGLWIFGPEYEGVSFTSNKGLRTVFRDLLGDRKSFIDQPLLRPDIVAVAEVFSRDSYGEDGEVNGLDKVLILELKRGGSIVSESEMQQMGRYARRISKSGNIRPNGTVVGFLLGSRLGDDTDKIRIGESNRISIEARTYQTIIRQAHSRTFNLREKISAAANNITL